jgi:UDP-4-amino-4,6-dideoxy-N-acetyl-beta-L-altrosamine transaminase
MPGAVRLVDERLAIQGGPPVRSTFLPYGRHEIDEDDVQAVTEVLRSGWITTGPQVGAFEAAVAETVGARHAVAFSSGTAALHGAAFAAGLGPGDEAITTPLTFCATANCVLYQGATPVFADVSADTLNLDPDEVSRRLTSRSKAVLAVDFTGHPADLDPLLELAERNGLTLIEDACHALGARYRGRPVGAISHMTVFSFHPVKHVTTGEGGMVTTDDARLADRLRLLRNHGLDSDAHQRQARGQWRYDMVALGFNYRLADLGCALGLSQLRKLPANLARRREIAARYQAAFAGLDGVRTPVVKPDVDPAWHLFVIRVEGDRLRAHRDDVLAALRAENIGANVHYPPVHLLRHYRERFGYRGGEYPVAEGAFDGLVTLPLFPAMNDADVSDVVTAVEKVVGHFRA